MDTAPQDPDPVASRADIASAAESRVHQDHSDVGISSQHEKELRLAFRRLINPGILRPNSKEKALGSMKVLRLVLVVAIDAFSRRAVDTSYTV